MKAAFYQFDPVFGDKQGNIARVAEKVRQADIDLLVLPEFFATGYQFVSGQEVEELSETVPDGYTTDALSDLSIQTNMYIVAGLPEKVGSRFYNSGIITGPEGHIGVYRKTHLFFEETLYFTPGDTGFKVWQTDIGNIGIMICFDWFFPESARTLALLGADIIAHPSNLVLPYCPDSMPVRCLENRVFAVTANRIGTEKRKAGKSLKFIGKSEIVSPKGEILIRASEDEETVMMLDIDPQMARDKQLNEYNNLINDRHSRYYSPITSYRHNTGQSK